MQKIVKVIGQLILLLAVIVAILGLNGCETVSFYTQAARGQAEIVLKRQSISQLLDKAEQQEDAHLDMQLVDKLRYLQAARHFASEHLALPDNASYTNYVDLQRPYVVWNVVATEEFGIEPKQQCFPIAGCVTYRGYFSQAGANQYAEQLRADGLDVVVGGVSAYSTLGWFADPILNTMLNRPREDLAGLLFHELAHQQLYRKGETAFNESFATSVEREGLRAWLSHRQETEALALRLQRRARRDAVVSLILQHRTQIGARYAAVRASNQTGELNIPFKTALQDAKKAGFMAMRQAYAELKTSGGGTKGFDRWMASDLNNASLALFADYNTRVPEFTALLDRVGRDWQQFYRAVDALPE